jgi:amidophosphoribosyltransferase
MCGIVGVVSNAPVNQLIYDALLLLQHRGQDAAGIVTQQERKFFMHKAKGLVRDVFRTRNMRALPGNCGLGQVRYPTAGNAYSEEEAQPFYVNAPFGIVLVHNGNLTNAQALKAELFMTDHRHINTESDSEVLLNVLAHELDGHARPAAAAGDLFAGGAQRASPRARLLRGDRADRRAWRAGIPRPVRHPAAVPGPRADGTTMVASESVALEGTGHEFVRNVAPGEAVFIDLQGTVHTQQCAVKPQLIALHLRVRLPGAAGLRDGRHLGLPGAAEPGRDAGQARGLHRAARRDRRGDPDSRIQPPQCRAAGAVAGASPYREGFVKNRYVGRTFIMPGQAVRKKSVRQKLNAIASEFKGRNVLLVDDSIVRGNDQPRDRADGARGRRAQGLSGQCCAAGALSQRVRHRHAHQRPNWWRTTAPWRRSARSSVATR